MWYCQYDVVERQPNVLKNLTFSHSQSPAILFPSSLSNAVNSPKPSLPPPTMSPLPSKTAPFPLLHASLPLPTPNPSLHRPAFFAAPVPNPHHPRQPHQPPHHRRRTRSTLPESAPTNRATNQQLH